MHQKTQKLSSPRSLFFLKLKKLKNYLVPEAYISLKLEKKTQKYNFFHIWQIQNLEQVYPV